MHTKILERLTMYSKTNVRLSLVWMMSCRSTILACFKPFKREARKIKQNGIWSIDKESTVSFQIRCSGRFILFCFGLVWMFFLLLGGKKSLLLWKNYLEFPRTSGFQKWEVTLFTQTDQAYRQVQKLLLCFHLQNFVRHREHSVNVPPTPTPGDLFLLDLEEAWRDNSHWKRKRGVLFSGPGLYKYQCPTRAQLGWLMGMMGGRQR